VVGFPLYWEKQTNKYRSVEKDDLVVFPHRLDPEKNAKTFSWLKRNLGSYYYIKTMEKKRTKDEYYKILAKSKVTFSASLQETFGIGTVEAMMLGAIPIVPNRLAYVELYDRQFRYNDILEAKQKVEYVMRNYGTSKSLMDKLEKNKIKLIENGKNSINKMSRIIKGDLNG
jgi:glycosyltransferase involved in cell wall biosynthesis